MHSARILIVEDEGIVALDIEQRLESLGYKYTDVASSGEEALAKAREFNPDLVLMDIMLDGKIDGILAAEQIKTILDIPIIYLTACADEVTLQRAKMTEPYGYIIKPFKEKELHITIDMALYKHKMQKRLKESEKWLSTTLLSIGDAVITTDSKGLVTFINPVAESLIGWKLEDAKNKSLSEIFNIINKNTRMPVENPAAKVLADGVTRGLTNHTVLISRDGKEIPIDDSAAPIKDDEGNIVGAVLVFRDITEREKAAQEQEITIEYLRMVNTISESRTLIETSKSFFKEKSGCNDVLISLKTDEDWVNFKGRESFWTNCTTELLNRGNIEEHLAFICKKCNAEGYESLALIPLIAGNECLGLMLFKDRRKDVFTPKIIALWERLADYLAVALAEFRAEEALRESEERYRIIAKELQEADKRKNEFLAVLSHELRNPLTTISNSLQILEWTSPGGEQAKHALGVINRQVKQLSRLVDDLLDITRITQNRIELKRQVLDLNELVRRTIEDHRLLFQNNGIYLEKELPPYPVLVNADEARIMQVIGNLLYNAVKFTDKGGTTRVSVSCDVLQKKAIISVVDTGIGLEPVMISRIFEPFAQAEISLSRNRGGLGLGLALSKRIIEMHGGSITASSAGLGKGSEFLIFLPLEDAMIEKIKNAPKSFKNSHRILIIDDIVDLVDTLRELLEIKNYEVAVAYNGIEGINKALEFLPEVVLCDIGLPKMNGYEVARAFRSDDRLKNVYMIALSGYAMPQDIKRAADAGFNCHLTKPVDLNTLEKIIAQVPAKAGR